MTSRRTELWDLQFLLCHREYAAAAAVSPQLRNQILAGNDINLVKILLCSAEASDRRFVDCGDVSVILKESDPGC